MAQVLKEFFCIARHTNRASMHAVAVFTYGVNVESADMLSEVMRLTCYCSDQLWK